MKIDGNTPITLSLNLESVHAILTSLGTQPYDKVAGIVANIQQQSATQLQAMQEAAKAANDAPSNDLKPAA